MSEPRRSPAPALPAATVLVIRDTPTGLEVLMVERHARIDFAGGALVFPGGKVDAGDADPALRERLAGGEALGREARALRAAAVRELFEESGILLARPAGAPEMLPAEHSAALAARHREDLHAGRLTLSELAAREDLELATDALVPFAHWITPEPSPKRFDTHFFLTPAPARAEAIQDGREAVGALWIAPAMALADASAGRRTLVFPTRLNLGKLARHRSVGDALAAARAAPVVTVMPRVERRPEGYVVRLPAEAGYDVVEAPVDELFKR